MYSHSRYIFLSFILLLIIVLFHLQNPDANLDNIRVMGFFAIIQLVFSYYSWYKCGNNLFSAHIVFLTAFYAFNVGQVILEALGVNPTNKSLLEHRGMSQSVFYECAYYSLLCLLAFHIGALLESKRTKGFIYNSISRDDISYKIETIRKVSFTLFCISLPFYFVTLYLSINAVLMYGYGALYDDSINTGNPLFSLIGDFYDPSLIALYFVSEWKKKQRRLWRTILILTVFLPPLILGGRSQAMIIATICVLVYSFFYKIKVKHVLLGVCSVYILLFIFNIVAKTRSSSDKSLEHYAEVVSDAENNPAIETLAEMGGSMNPLALTMAVVPSTEDYRYGKSIFYSFLSIIPNVGFWRIHPAQKEAKLGRWLMEKYNMTYGPGYSLVAEGYINFGYMGPFALLLLGFYYTKIFKYVDKKFVEKNPFVVILAIVFLWFSIKGVRNGFIGAVRAFFYYAGPMYLLFNFYYKKHFKS